jgi:hypothetical protein
LACPHKRRGPLCADYFSFSANKGHRRQCQSKRILKAGCENELLAALNIRSKYHNLVSPVLSSFID